ncbi:MAG: hypothetical protein E6R06_19760 [Mycobacterium sp.]|nr:MAG: hypothetical protein E6R06_19760 [Mycobacterium sp.]
MTSTNELRFAAFVTAFAEEFPGPTPQQRAELERVILSAIAADGREVVPWRRVIRSIPDELRPFAPDVLTGMWLSGDIWMASVKGQWQVAKGDAADRARADRDRHHGSVTPPIAV